MCEVHGRIVIGRTVGHYREEKETKRDLRIERLLLWGAPACFIVPFVLWDDSCLTWRPFASHRARQRVRFLPSRSWEEGNTLKFELLHAVSITITGGNFFPAVALHRTRGGKREEEILFFVNLLCLSHKNEKDWPSCRPRLRFIIAAQSLSQVGVRKNKTFDFFFLFQFLFLSFLIPNAHICKRV